MTIIDIKILPARADAQCNFLNSTLCDVVLRDTFTLILTLWISFQLIWITMLCVVQMIQISRNQTTYESMRSHSLDRDYPSAHATVSATATGALSSGNAGLPSGQAPNTTPASSGPRQRPGCFQQWKQLLGFDTFLATAQASFTERRGSSRQRNPFSHGPIANCRDFWCDPAPFLGKREPGSAVLGGEPVNYYRMYEAPLRMHGGGRGYRSLVSEDPERMVG
jgi:palmitoyltransferase ZDHHC13/17